MKVISFEDSLFEGRILFFGVTSFKLSYPINSIPPGISYARLVLASSTLANIHISFLREKALQITLSLEGLVPRQFKQIQAERC